MNNSKIINDEVNKDTELEARSQLDKAQETSQGIGRVLQAVKNLKENPDYLEFKRLVMTPDILRVERLIEADIKNLKNDLTGEIKTRIITNQAMVVAYKKFANLDEVEQVFKGEFGRLNEVLKNYGR
jgi:hypothetical protein